MINTNLMFPDLVSRLNAARREIYEERASVREFDAGLPRAYAECAALLDVAVISSRELDRSDLENPAGGGTLQLAGVHGWRGVRQGGVGTEMVVVLPPGFDLRTGVLQRHEPVHVQALVA